MKKLYQYKKCSSCKGYNMTRYRMCSNCRKKARAYVKKMYGPSKK